MSDEKAICELCGQPMPEGEEMFNYHGYSGPCPKPEHPPNARYTCEACGKEIISGADSQNVVCHSCGHVNKSRPNLVQ